MTTIDWAQKSRVCISAVLAHLQMPAGVLADFGQSDRLEIESQDDTGPVVSFEVEGNSLAVARLTQRDGRLVAVISSVGRATTISFNSWSFKKKAEAASEGSPVQAQASGGEGSAN